MNVFFDAFMTYCVSCPYATRLYLDSRLLLFGIMDYCVQIKKIIFKTNL